MKILVALDGSDAAFNAMKSACRIALRTRSYVTAFYVNKGAEYSPEETGWTSIKERIARELETFGHEVIHKAYEIGKEFDVPVEGVMSEGLPAHEIVKYVGARGIINLLAMGHSSKGRSAQEFVESTTKQVVSQSSVPVLVTSAEIDIKNVLIAVDDSEVSRKVTAFGGRLAKSFGADIGIVTYVPDSEAIINEYRLIAEVPNIDKHIEASEKTLKEMMERAISATNAILDSIGISASSITKKEQSEDIVADAKNHDVLIAGIKREGSHNKLGRLANKLLVTPSVAAILVQ